MKYLISLLIAIILISNNLLAAKYEGQQIDNNPPKECHTANFSCVLKFVDGYPFWCLKPSRDRYRKSQRKIRVTKEINCHKRFPAVLKVTEEKTPESEE